MEVYLMICRDKASIFMKISEATKFSELRHRIAESWNIHPQNILMYDDKEETVYLDRYRLLDYGILFETAKEHRPAIINVVVKNEEKSV